ncbi:MAG: hypothetical protein ACLFTP_11960 [Rhodosalinus sp.]
MSDPETFFRQLWACTAISVQEIADHYGVTRQAIHDRAKRRGLPPRGVRADAHIKDRERFRQMWLAGVMQKDIARVFQTTETVVRNTAHCMGLPRRRRRKGQRGYAAWGSIPITVYREQLMADAMSRAAGRS